MSSEKEIGITVKKKENFSEWYIQVVLKADLADYAGIKGFIALKPYGYAIWEKIQAYLERRFKETGHSNVYLPALIPESLLRKEEEHFAGFTPEVFWVDYAGDEKLSERLAVRPTSETIVYDSFSRWVRSWRDLPILINMWNSVLRAEIKSTKPFIRTSEFLWQEGHTAHATKEEADEEVMRMLWIYRDLIEGELAIPVIAGLKSEAEKFKGALYTATLEAMMPDGKALQMGTSHNLGQNFTKPFDVKFLGRDGQWQYAWTTSWGVSWRLIGAIIMVHGDDRGLVLPPRVAPIQTVVIPIYYREVDRKKILDKCERVAQRLRLAGIAVYIDASEEKTPGWKFHEWELKGVPLRIEVGPRDLQLRQVTATRRDTLERLVIRDAQLVRRVRALLADIQRSLYEKASGLLKELTSETDDYGELKRIVNERGGFVKAGWCGSPDCEASIKNESGATIRAIPFEHKADGRLCIYCGQKATALVYFAPSY